MSAVEYAALFAASVAFEFAYVGWARSAAASSPVRTTAYSIATAGLGLLGLKGALELPGGWALYLAGIGLGAWVSAYLAARALSNKHTSS
jgi:hypothetical protein